MKDNNVNNLLYALRAYIKDDNALFFFTKLSTDTSGG